MLVIFKSENKQCETTYSLKVRLHQVLHERSESHAILYVIRMISVSCTVSSGNRVQNKHSGVDVRPFAWPRGDFMMGEGV